jgi:hypothetical protein
VEGREPPVHLLGEDVAVTSVRAVALAVLTALTVLLGGCTSPSAEKPSASGSGGSSSASSSTSAGASSSAPPAVPAAPKAHACYRLTPAQLARPTNDSPPVSCRGGHNARTIFVGRLHTVIDGHSIAVDSSRVQRQLSTTCPRKLAAYVGGNPSTRDLSRLNVVWYSPSIEQSDRGADRFRCDVIAFGREQKLAPLPRGDALRGVLSKPGSLATYGLCGTTAPGAPGFQRVICRLPHGWRAFATIGLPGGKAYPGPAAVRKAGDGSCRAQARARSSDSLKFRYGWEWPTREQWLAGQHFGYCWVPA